MMLQQVVAPAKLMENLERFESSEEPSDRSSSSPSNADDLNDLMMEEESNTVIISEEKTNEPRSEVEKRVQVLEENFTFIQHQLSQIMEHLHAEPCKCAKCLKVQKKCDNSKKETIHPTEMLTQLFPNASEDQLKTLLELSKLNKLPTTVIPSEKPVEKPDLGTYQNAPGGGKIITERLSEPVKRSRKGPLGLPAATFYRKDSGSQVVPPLTPVTPSTTVVPPPSANTSTASPGPSSDDDHQEMMPMEIAMGSVTTPTTPGNNLFTQSMVDMLKMNAQNAAHSTGSPGFLRGRGRGRPKLIGDELDADLVDYMVSLKNSDPHGGHFTASQALHMARQYILERAPGLLEEHGGHVKLKLTWAMKLVSRIGERQKEIEYGLPAGTLSNMGRNLTNLPGGNFMTDMMAQNIFSQQMLMMNQFPGKSSGSATSSGSAGSAPVKPVEPKHQNEENLNMKVEASMPEIVNIKELNLPFLNNFLAELNEKNSSSSTMIDGELAANLFASNA